MALIWKCLKNAVYCALLACGLFSCGSLHLLDSLPDNTYVLSRENYAKLTGNPDAALPAKIKAEIEWDDSVMQIMPQNTTIKAEVIAVPQIKHVHLRSHTLDINILTVPFKARPPAAGFPPQLNADFCAAMYLGHRYDFFALKNMQKNSAAKPQISAYGLGYGGFLGLGTVGMNPFVTRNSINYEYDGLAVNAGLAAIYDPKKFNIGLALGLDYLLDKNREAWIYQGRPWLGSLFGINLN